MRPLGGSGNGARTNAIAAVRHARIGWQRHSLRICLIRAIASSTACSGLMPSVTMRWIAFAQIRSV
jgi:hypothetical protein